MVDATPTAVPTREQREPGLIALWFGILGPPAIWIARLSASYALVPFVCQSGWTWLLNGITAAALLGSVLAGFVAYRSWRAARGGTGSGTGARTRFMGILGMLIATLFSAVIVAEGLANLMVAPCLTGGAPL